MNRSLRLIPAFLLLFSAGLFAFGKNVVILEPFRNGKAVALNLNILKGFGVQKKGPNELVLYRLRAGHQLETDLNRKITRFGSALETVSSLSGSTAPEDPKYFGSVKTVTFRKDNYSGGDLIIGGRLFYCSFADKFCSVQTVAQPVP